jgi:Heterokaryon incompatibility protein Het-C
MDSFELLLRNFPTLHTIQAEHIDNPKGYGDGEDARKYDPRLRGPVDVSRIAFFV